MITLTGHWMGRMAETYTGRVCSAGELVVADQLLFFFSANPPLITTLATLYQENVWGGLRRTGWRCRLLRGCLGGRWLPMVKVDARRLRLLLRCRVLLRARVSRMHSGSGRPTWQVARAHAREGTPQGTADRPRHSQRVSSCSRWGTWALVGHKSALRARRGPWRRRNAAGASIGSVLLRRRVSPLFWGHRSCSLKQLWLVSLLRC